MATGDREAHGRTGFGGAHGTICKYPGCTKPRYKESYGFTHDFCGRTHAQLYQSLSTSYTPASSGIGSKSLMRTQVSSTSSSRQPLKAFHSLPTSFKNLFSKEIKFYGRDEPYYQFTNFYPAPVTIDGQKWPTTEHYFQAQKFVGTPYVEIIRKLPAPRQAFQLSRDPKVSRWRRSDWDEVKDDIMYKAVRCKFDQHKYLRENLLETGDKKLIEHTTNDSYWGDGGGKGKGLNKLGEILMVVRKEMKVKYGRHKSKDNGYEKFKYLESTLAPGESSDTVRGLASPVVNRKNYIANRTSTHQTLYGNARDNSKHNRNHVTSQSNHMDTDSSPAKRYSSLSPKDDSTFKPNHSDTIKPVKRSSSTSNLSRFSEESVRYRVSSQSSLLSHSSDSVSPKKKDSSVSSSINKTKQTSSSFSATRMELPKDKSALKLSQSVVPLAAKTIQRSSSCGNLSGIGSAVVPVKRTLPPSYSRSIHSTRTSSSKSKRKKPNMYTPSQSKQTHSSSSAAKRLNFSNVSHDHKLITRNNLKPHFS